MMRFPRVACGPIVVLLVACGGIASQSTGRSGGATGSGGGSGSGSSADSGSTTGSDSGTASGPILGELFVTTEAFEGQLLETFTANLQPIPATTAFACPGASARVGACCVFPPVRPPPTLLPDSGTATSGTPNWGTNAGELALVDATSSATVGTFDFGSRGYAGLPASYYTTQWQPGDVLKVSATGNQIAAFAVSVPALSPPIVTFPSTLVATEDFRITWQPDPNAEKMSVQIIDGDSGSVEVVCSAPDADGAVTVDASLFAAFKSGDFCQGTADRETVRYAQTPKGRVALWSFGYSASVDVRVK